MTAASYVSISPIENEEMTNPPRRDGGSADRQGRSEANSTQPQEEGGRGGDEEEHEENNTDGNDALPSFDFESTLHGLPWTNQGTQGGQHPRQRSPTLLEILDHAIAIADSATASNTDTAEADSNNHNSNSNNNSNNNHNSHNNDATNSKGGLDEKGRRP